MAEVNTQQSISFERQIQDLECQGGGLAHNKCSTDYDNDHIFETVFCP